MTQHINVLLSLGIKFLMVAARISHGLYEYLATVSKLLVFLRF